MILAVPSDPARYADVVRRHQGRTRGYLLAFQVECRDIVDQEVLRIRRTLRAIEPGGLDGIARGSWVLGVLLCPGDDLGALVPWARGLSAADRDRILLYHRPRTDIEEALRGWAAAGMDGPVVTPVRDFATFHKVFGKHFNDRVWLDHA